MSRCRSCNAPIRWAKTVNNKPIPLDLAPVENGNVVLDAGIAVVVAPGKGQYVSHFSTCANADQHRKKG